MVNDQREARDGNLNITGETIAMSKQSKRKWRSEGLHDGKQSSDLRHLPEKWSLPSWVQWQS
jgi:hypothetical protein